jgi:hypothetical protein
VVDSTARGWNECRSERCRACPVAEKTSTFQRRYPMSNQPPPVPPAGRSDKGPAGASKGNATADTPSVDDTPANLKEQDRQGNIKQNTTHQGYQQDR